MLARWFLHQYAMRQTHNEAMCHSETLDLSMHCSSKTSSGRHRAQDEAAVPTAAPVNFTPENPGVAKHRYGMHPNTHSPGLRCFSGLDN